MGSTDFQITSGNVLAQLTLYGADLGKVSALTTSTESTSTNVVAFPTDSKIREQEARRAAKAAGHEIVKVKQKKFVQDHTDDCGEDMSSIGAIEILLNHQWIDQCDSTDSEGDLSDTVGDGLAHTMLYGSCDDLHCYICNLQVFVARDVDELVLVAQRNGHSIFDLAEICGGQGRTSQLAVRRRKRAGENFDLVTHTDLAKPREAAAAYAYFQVNTLWHHSVVVFGPLEHQL